MSSLLPDYDDRRERNSLSFHKVIEEELELLLVSILPANDLRATKPLWESGTDSEPLRFLFPPPQFSSVHDGPERLQGDLMQSRTHMKLENDKATILCDTIQMLKDLTAQVNQLKAENNSLSEESRELTQEKNELREEKASLKSEVDNLTTQYQQRLGYFHSWATLDPSVAVHHPVYPFPLPFPVPSAPLPIHPVQTYPFFHHLNHGTISNPYPTCLPYSSSSIPQVEQSSDWHSGQILHERSTRSHASSHTESRNKTSDHDQRNSGEINGAFSDVATELELKTPGSAVFSKSKSAPGVDIFYETRKAKDQSQLEGNSIPTVCSSSRCSSTCSVPGDKSNGLEDDSISEN